MVFKKPYGFLIKHFKLIHLILTGLFIYLTMTVSNILNYYNNFIDKSASRLDAINYMNEGHLIAAFLAIIICIVVYILLRYKKKPRALYIGLIAFILLVVGMISIVQGGLEVIYNSTLDVRTLRAYRDLLKILIVFEYLSVGIVLVRGLGFDIKKFNFASDMHELNLDISDEEEVELSLEGTEVVQRKVNRNLRELKYYYIENKFFINIIISIIAVLGISFFFVNTEIINKVYEEKEQFSYDAFSFRVLDSYITRNTYENEVIAKKDKSYVIVRTIVASNSNKALNPGNLLLKVNNNSYSINSYNGKAFSDLGNAYKKQSINGTYTYLFIFYVNNDDLDKDMSLEYTEDRKVKLKPINLDEVKDPINLKLNDTLDLSNTTFGNGNIVITNFEINDKFTYPFEYEMGGEIFKSEYTITSSGGTLLKIDLNASYPLNMKGYDFFKKYATLKYKLENVEYTTKAFDDKTPAAEKNNLYVAVDKKIKDAQSIWFEVQIRNYKYVYTIK